MRFSWNLPVVVSGSVFLTTCVLLNSNWKWGDEHSFVLFLCSCVRVLEFNEMNVLSVDMSMSLSMAIPWRFIRGRREMRKIV